MLSTWFARRAVIAGGLVAALAFAARPARADAPLKIGYFDVKRILGEVDEAKAAKSKLEEEFKKKQKQLDDQKAELERAQRELEQKAPVLSQSAKEQMQMELAQKFQAAQKLYVDLQQDLGQKEQQALSDLIGRLDPVVREIAEDEGYTFVFEKNEAGLFYAPTGHDLTAQVIRKYNLRYPPKGGTAAAKGEKPKAGDKK
jgi:outer membrane protein